VDGVFETGLEVVEQDLELDTTGPLQQINLMFEEGKLTQEQMQELVARQLKQ
jgi:hypothetical protein